MVQNVIDRGTGKADMSGSDIRYKAAVREHGTERLDLTFRGDNSPYKYVRESPCL